MNVETIEIDKLVPYQKNPRKNPNADKVAASIKEYGFQQPIVVDKNLVIVVGHTRYAASKMLGLKEVPVVVADLDEKKATAYRIADNRLNQDTDWEYKFLTEELNDLVNGDFDLSKLGFEDAELDSLLSIDDVQADWFKPDEHWNDMPSFDHQDLKPYRTVVIHVRNADDLADLSGLIKQDIKDSEQEKRNGVPVTSMWHPVRINDVLKDKGYSSE